MFSSKMHNNIPKIKSASIIPKYKSKTPTQHEHLPSYSTKWSPRENPKKQKMKKELRGAGEGNLLSVPSSLLPLFFVLFFSSTLCSD